MKTWEEDASLDEMRRRKNVNCFNGILTAVIVLLILISVGLFFVAVNARDDARNKSLNADFFQMTARYEMTRAGVMESTSEARLEENQNIYAVLLGELAEFALQNNNPRAALRLVLEMVNYYPLISEQKTHRLLLNSVNQSAREFNHITHDGPIAGIQWSADERTILSWSEDKTARVWDAMTGEEVLRLEHEHPVDSAAWNADESRILTASLDGFIQVWDAETGKNLLSFEHEITVAKSNSSLTVEWVKDDTRILSYDANGVIRLWDAETGDLLLDYWHGGKNWGYLNGVSWNADETQLLTWSNERTVRVWDMTEGHNREEALLTLNHSSSVFQATWSQAENQIMTLATDGYVHVWNARNGHELLRMYHSGLSGAIWTADEDIIITRSVDIIIWDAHTGEELLTLDMDGYRTDMMLFDDEHQRLLARTNTTELTVWYIADDFSEATPLYFPDHEHNVYGTLWNHDKNHFLTWTNDGIYLWSAENGNRLLFLETDLPVKGGATSYAEWSQDEKRLLLWTRDGHIWLYNFSNDDVYLSVHQEASILEATWNQDESQILTRHPEGISILDVQTGMAFDLPEAVLDADYQIDDAVWNQDDTQLLTRCSDRTIRLWDAGNGIEQAQEILTLSYGDTIVDAAWNADETRLLVQTGDYQIYVYDAAEVLESGDALFSFQPENEIYGTAWSPDSSQLLIWSVDGQAYVLDGESGETLLVLTRTTPAGSTPEPEIAERESSPLIEAQWNQHGTQIMTLSLDGRVFIYDTQTGDLRFVLYSRGSRILGAAWSPDDRRIVTWNDNSRLETWHAETGVKILDIAVNVRIYSASWKQDSAAILVTSLDSYARIINPDTGSTMVNYQQGETLLGAVWSQQDDLAYEILSWSPHTIRIWDSANGATLFSLNRLQETIAGAVWSADESQVLFWTEEGTVAVWIVGLDRLIEVGNQLAGRELNNQERQEISIPLQAATFAPTYAPITPSATMTLAPMQRGAIQTGEYKGQISGSYEVWTYNGQAGEILQIQALADHPANTVTGDIERNILGLLDIAVLVYGPHGNLLVRADDIAAGINTDVLIENLVLSYDGIYQIEVHSWQNHTTGSYTLIVESGSEILPTSTPLTPTPTQAPFSTRSSPIRATLTPDAPESAGIFMP